MEVADKLDYKGFTIHKLKVNYHVAAVGFKPEGYATLNNAKGAITKHIAKLEQREERTYGLAVEAIDYEPAQYMSDDEMDAALDATEHTVKGLQATNDSKSYASMDTETERAVEAVEGLAEASYKVQSRNKREGRHIGRMNSKHMRDSVLSKVQSMALNAITRKQRKLAAIRAKHYKG